MNFSGKNSCALTEYERNAVVHIRPRMQIADHEGQRVRTDGKKVSLTAKKVVLVLHIILLFENINIPYLLLRIGISFKDIFFDTVIAQSEKDTGLILSKTPLSQSDFCKNRNGSDFD